MIDLNVLRVFATVASLRNFSAAGHVLGMSKSSVSRCVAQLEAHLGIRLVQRTTRQVVLTEPGAALLERCTAILGQIDEALDDVGNAVAAPRGMLRISAAIGFGINVLSELLPPFLERYPDVSIGLELTSQTVDLLAAHVDVAIRMGPLPDSQLVATRIGTIPRCLYVAPAYVSRHGAPQTPADLRAHDTIEMPGLDGRARSWILSRETGETARIDLAPRVTVNDVLTLHRLVVKGSGIGCLAESLCKDDIEAGRLIRLFPDWSLPTVDVNVIFPSKRDLSPTVRAFVDFLKTSPPPFGLWRQSTIG